MVKKIFTYIRNIVYAKYTYYLIRKETPKKIVDYEKFLKDLSSPKKDDKRTLQFKSGFKLECNIIDLGAIAETCITEDYQRYEKLKIKPGDIVFDVGAHIGSFSIYAANKGAYVYAFEPDIENFTKLQKNVSINNLANKIQAFNFGIHSFTGEVTFDVSESNKGGHSILTNNSKIKTSISVKTFTDVFTELSIESVDLLKIDIEGSEYEIFEKLTQKESSVIKKIVGEYHLIPEKPNWNYGYLKKTLNKHYADINSYIPYYFYALTNKTHIVGDDLSYLSHNSEYETTSNLEWCQKHFALYEKRNDFQKLGFENEAINASKTIKKHIDIGSGAGWLLIKTAPLFDEVIGIEPSLAAIKTAKQLTNNSSNIEYRNTDMMSLSEEIKDSNPVFLTTSTVLSHINDKTVNDFLEIVNNAPIGSALYFGEPYNKNRQQYLWHIRSKEWWAKNLPNWELKFSNFKTKEYLYGISGQCVGKDKVKNNYNLNLFQKIFWAMTGLKSRVKYIVKSIILLLTK